MSETASVNPGPATPVAAPIAPPMAKRRNALGVVALIVAIVGFFVPLIVLIVGVVYVVSNPLPGTDSGWDWVRVVTFYFFGAGIAGIPGIIALGLGIGSLFVKGAGKVAGIIAIVIGTIVFLVALPLLPLGLVLFTG